MELRDVILLFEFEIFGRRRKLLAEIGGYSKILAKRLDSLQQ